MSGTNASHYEIIISKILFGKPTKDFPLLESATFLQKIQNPSSIYKLTERK